MQYATLTIEPQFYHMGATLHNNGFAKVRDDVFDYDDDDTLMIVSEYTNGDKTIVLFSDATFHNGSCAGTYEQFTQIVF